jgi:DNA polymerase elongation subunit (family B)
MSNTYISAVYDQDHDKILVWERPIAGGPRGLREYEPPRYFYVPSPDGEYTSITGEKLAKVEANDKDEFQALIKKFSRRFESDVQPLARLLMDVYQGRATPVVNYAFIDIEVDYDSKIGFSSPENPYAPINAVTIYQSWTREYITYVVPPKGFKLNEKEFREKLVQSWIENKLGFEPNVFICKNERELLAGMLEEIEEADIVSGWNSEFFDLPYIIKRLERLFGTKGTGRLCFPGGGLPRARKVNRFGTETTVYSLRGRTHLDYLDLFKKFTFEGRVSYSLANIAAEELDVPKLDYDGTLEQLYNRDFVHFITYNARDVEVLVKLDQKFKLMQLVNQMAHENTVPFEAILGTVRYVETGIMNRAHQVHNLICTDKVIPDTENAKVEGAIVMTPLAGLHRWIGSVDITSLYPSVIRALNMSVETFIGQFTEEEKAWNGINARDDNLWCLDMPWGADTRTGAEWYDVLREMNWAISAFGTVFDQARPGMVADTLTFWFSERKRLQAEKKKYSKLAKEETDPVKKAEYERQAEHYDLLQLTKKIQLNSTYGALLNEAFRFGRREIGASVTGTGRQISIHMGQTIGELVTGQPCKIEKRYSYTREAGNKSTYVPGISHSLNRYTKNFEALDRLPTEPAPMIFGEEDGDNDETQGAVYYTRTDEVIYGDTDSCYFMTRASNYEEAVATADEVAARTNATFPEFMASKFNCTGGRENLIQAAREVVAEAGLFLFAKKKYTLKVVNLEGADLRAKPKLKSMGSEIKKADTPKVVQEFLKGLMDLVLSGKDHDELERFVNTHRGSLIHRTEDLLALGTAKQVNNLDALYAEWKRTEKIGRGKVRLPGHVRAAVNYNECLEAFDPGGKAIRSGDKAVIFYLRPNSWQFKSIAFPADMMHLPEWFKENFQIDMQVTEQKLIDMKIKGIFEALGQELPTPQTAYLKSVFTF